MTPSYKLFSLSLILPLTLCLPPAYLLTAQFYDEYNRDQYTASVRIGDPPIYYRLSIDFSVSTVVLFKDLARLSRTYSEAFSGSDFVVIGTVGLRIPVLINAGNTAGYRTCANCDGVLGLARTSVLWMGWPQISLTKNMIVFGARHWLFDFGHGCDFSLARCASLDGEYLCTAKGYISGEEYNVSVGLHGKTVLPLDVYDSYVHGKNIYRDDYYTWDSLEISLPRAGLNPSPLLPAFDGLEQYLYDTCTSDFTLVLRGGDMVIASDSSTTRELLLEPYTNQPPEYTLYPINAENISNTNHIVLGVQAWRSFSSHYDSRTEVIYFLGQSTMDHYYFIVCVAMLCLLVIYYYWKATSIIFNLLVRETRVHAMVLWHRDNVCDIMTRFLGYIVGGFSVALPPALQDLSSLPLFYVYPIVQVSVLFCIDALCMVISVHMGDSIRWGRGRASHAWIRLNMIQNVTFPAYLLTSLWFLASQTRQDIVSSWISTIFICIFFYDLTVNLIILIIYMTVMDTSSQNEESRERPTFLTPLFISFFLLVFPLLYCSTGYVLVVRFLNPLMKYLLSQISASLTELGTVVAMAALVNTSYFMVQLYMQKAVDYVLAEKIEDDKKK